MYVHVFCISIKQLIQTVDIGSNETIMPCVLETLISPVSGYVHAILGQ